MCRFYVRAFAAALAAALTLAAVACGGGDPEELTFEVNIKEGSVDETDSVLRVKQDDTVTIVVSSDDPINFHLHGYDIEKEVKPGEPATLQFTADATGSFPFTIHVGTEGHMHDEEDGACEAQPPSGAPKPTLVVSAVPGKEHGEIDVTVEVENFVLSFETADKDLATGHWHLFVGDELKGMYAQPQASAPVDSPGEYHVRVGLADLAHCDYGIEAMTMVMVKQGQAGVGEETPAAEHDSAEHDEEQEDGEEIELGRLEVHPR